MFLVINQHRIDTDFDKQFGAIFTQTFGGPGDKRSGPAVRVELHNPRQKRMYLLTYNFIERKGKQFFSLLVHLLNTAVGI